MKTWLFLTTALTVALPTLEYRAGAADAVTNTVSVSPADAQRAEETKLIAVLRSSASPHDKDAACARLKFIGTENSIPVLAALLTDEQLSHSARYALEPMQSPKAGKALIAALNKTTGMTQVGIIDSLAYRGEAAAVPQLAALVSSSDLPVATAAAAALGQIGNAKALKALQKSTANTAGKVHDAVVDSLLRCALRLNAAGKHEDALVVFKQIYDNQSGDRFRVAAYRGMIQAAGTNALPYLTTGIKGKDGAAQFAALQMVRSVHAPNATPTLAALLTAVEAPVQIALIGELAQRDDPSAASAVASMLLSKSHEVRLAAIVALGTLGDAAMVPMLAKAATSPDTAEQEAARLSLVQLRRGKCSEAIVAILPGATPAVQAELARALGDRRDTNSIPRLIELARTGADSARVAALQALGSLVDQSQLGDLVVLVRDAKSPQAREQAAQAFASACRSIKARRGTVNFDPLIQELSTGPTEVKVALFPVSSTLNDPKIRAAIRAGVESNDPQVRNAAIRALCDTTDPELAPDVMKLVREAKEENYRTLALRGAVRLNTQEEGVKLNNTQRVEALKNLLSSSLTDAQKRIVLSGLGQVQDKQSLLLVTPFLDEAAVQSEAAQATISLASALPYTDMEVTTVALKKVIAGHGDDATKQAAQKALDQIQAVTDYVLTWEVSGPYKQAGKDYSELFGMVFPPEQGEGDGATWRPIGPGADPKTPWVIDLLGPLGGEQRVAYVRAWIFAEQKTPARLEMGSDDGLKVWLNHEVVHTNNIFRGFSAGTDQVNVTLNAGWNPLLLKVTQLNGGWAVCARVVTPEGKHLEGVKFSSDSKAAHQASLSH